MTTTEAEKVKAIMGLYYKLVDAHEKQLTQARENVALYLRELLAPILHRWGMGMRKGGALLYLNPNMEGEDVVEVDKGCDYVLGELHDELAGALWEEVGDGTLHDYIEDIDIPQSDGEDGGVHYVWLVQWSGGLTPLRFNDSYTVTERYSPETKYYGPITIDFINEVAGIGQDYEYLKVLPKYNLREDDSWVRVLDEPRTPGLLKGKVGSGIYEPLSDEELQQWGQTATE